MSGVDLRSGYYGTERDGSGSPGDTAESANVWKDCPRCGAIWRGLGEHPCPGKVAAPAPPPAAPPVPAPAPAAPYVEPARVLCPFAGCLVPYVLPAELQEHLSRHVETAVILAERSRRRAVGARRASSERAADVADEERSHDPIDVTFPCWTVSEANVTEGNFWPKRRRSAEQRKLTLAALAPFSPPVLPCIVILTRIAWGTCDSDNLASCCKAIRDATARFIGCDDGDERVVWRYRQAVARDKVPLRTKTQVRMVAKTQVRIEIIPGTLPEQNDEGV